MKIEAGINAGKRLDAFLQEHSGVTRNFAQKSVENGCVRVNGSEKKASYKLKMGDVVEIEDDFTDRAHKGKTMPEIQPQNIPLDILYEDDTILVVNKPKKMLTHPTPNNLENTLVNALLWHCGENLSTVDAVGEKLGLRRGIVHRLDKNTAGLLVVAKTNAAHKNLAEQIKNKTATRKYLGIVLGNIVDDEGVINKPIAKNLGETVKMYVPKNPAEGAPSLTRYKVLERFEGSYGAATFVEMQLETGRTHQIRVHFSSINHPVFGDTLYGSRGFQKFSRIKTTEQVLQSYFLAFTHPTTGDKMEFKLDPERFDKDLVRVLKILRSENK